MAAHPPPSSSNPRSMLNLIPTHPGPGTVVVLGMIIASQPNYVGFSNVLWTRAEFSSPLLAALVPFSFLFFFGLYFFWRMEAMLAKKAVVAIGTISVGTNSTMQHRYQLFGPCARVSHAIKKAKTELNDLGRWFVMCHGVHPIYVGPVSEIRKKKSSTHTAWMYVSLSQ